LAKLESMRIDVYCKVVDNWGDAGFCWRLSRYLHHFEKATVRLIIDGLETFTALGISEDIAQKLGVELHAWPANLASDDRLPDIMIAAFACDLPLQVRQSIRDQAISPQGQRTLWINLEYLSAESWVDTHHWKPSMKSDGAVEMFYMPGFTTTSGGLLGNDFIKTSDEELLDAIKLPTKQAGERWASLFCYPQAQLGLLKEITHPLTLIVPKSIDLSSLELSEKHPVQIHRINHLSQWQYDALLRYCDFNFVRGEDSWVRAQLVGKPFIWQPYLQTEDTHLVKLKAFCNVFEGVAKNATGWQAAMHAWSGSASHQKNPNTNPIAALLNQNQPTFDRFSAGFSLWQAHLAAQPPLTTRLMQAHQSWLADRAGA
jgi:uncharacterized repeat protein (TIGR03837 family)